MNGDINQTELGLPQEPSLQIDPNAELKANHEVMLKEIRSWALWSLGLGTVHLLQSGFLDSSWGILLIMVGLASFYFRTAPMFIVYTVTLSWAAISNLGSLNPQWMIFAVIQFYLVFRTAKDFRRFGETENQMAQISGENLAVQQRASKSFPWIGVLLSSAAIFGCIAYAALTFLLVGAFGPDSAPPAYYVFLIRMVEIISVLGFAVSLSSLLAKHTPKTPSIIGAVAGGSMLLMFLGLNIFFLLFG